MSPYFTRGFAAATATLLGTHAAFADLTAQDVWGEVQDYLNSSGYQISSSEATSGNVLTVSDLAMTMDMSDQPGGTVGTMTASQITFTENGDGTVTINLPAEMPLSLTMPNGEGSAKMRYVFDDTAIVTSGSVDDLAFATTAKTIGFEMDQFTPQGEPDETAAVTMSFQLSDLQGQTTVQKKTIREYAQTLTAGGMSYLLSVVPSETSENPESARFEGSLTGLTIDATGTMPTVATPGDIKAMLEDGMVADMTFAFSGGQGSMQGTSAEGDFAMQRSSNGGRFQLKVDKDQLGLNTSQTGASITLQTKDIPFPLNMQMAEVAYNMDMPISKSDSEQPFALSLKLADFNVADQLWGMFDPAGILPHDAANIVLDITGTAKLFYDMFDPAQMAQAELSGKAPGELNSLKVSDLLVSVAGAELSGTGDFTFDNSQPVPFPMPIGTSNLKLVGANGLIDGLIQMGLLKEQDAMGARMMMGMMAVPGEGDDTLLSTIEMNDKGQIFANGQRLK